MISSFYSFAIGLSRGNDRNMTIETFVDALAQVTTCKDSDALCTPASDGSMQLLCSRTNQVIGKVTKKGGQRISLTNCVGKITCAMTGLVPSSMYALLCVPVCDSNTMQFTPPSPGSYRGYGYCASLSTSSSYSAWCNSQGKSFITGFGTVGSVSAIPVACNSQSPAAPDSGLSRCINVFQMQPGNLYQLTCDAPCTGSGCYPSPFGNLYVSCSGSTMVSSLTTRGDATNYAAVKKNWLVACAGQQRPCLVDGLNPTLSYDLQCSPVPQPTVAPTVLPVKRPVSVPVALPVGKPSFQPTKYPTYTPTFVPTFVPVHAPTLQPKPVPVPVSPPTPVSAPVSPGGVCYETSKACAASSSGSLQLACTSFATGKVIGRLIDQSNLYDVAIKACTGQTTACTMTGLSPSTTYTLQCVPVCDQYTMQLQPFQFNSGYSGKSYCYAKQYSGGYNVWCNSNPTGVSLITGFGVAGYYSKTSVQVIHYCSTVSGQSFYRCGGPFYIYPSNVYELTCNPIVLGQGSSIIPSDFGTAFVQCPAPSKVDTVTTPGDPTNYALLAKNWPFPCRGWSSAIFFYDKVTPKPCLVGNLDPAKVYTLTCSVF